MPSLSGSSRYFTQSQVQAIREAMAVDILSVDACDSAKLRKLSSRLFQLQTRREQGEDRTIERNGQGAGTFQASAIGRGSRGEDSPAVRQAIAFHSLQLVESFGLVDAYADDLKL